MHIFWAGVTAFGMNCFIPNRNFSSSSCENVKKFPKNRRFESASSAGNNNKKPPKILGGFLLLPAGVTGLEPATSSVTGKRSNQLSYTPKY